MSGIINKIKEAVHSDNKAHHGAPEGSHGPHNSRVANAADPRVDSDRDGSHNISGTTGRTANPLGSSTTTGRHAGPLGNTSGTAEGTHGPHNSRVANAVDPRVDSDRDGSKTMGTGNTLGTSTGRTANPFGSSTTTGRTANPLGSSGTSEGVHGPHSSRVANAMDPRVDSDRDGSTTIGGTGNTMGNFGSTGASGITGSSGFGSGTTGVTGTHGAPAGTYGPHSSRVGNTLDPRVDSDRDGRGALGAGPGPASNTAGPHTSDILNKVDPRVDSDLDGSKTMGGNKTFDQSSAIRDPTDAAQVPPSVLRAHLGDPIIEHDDKHHRRERRNSVRSAQEEFRGI
ncbi:hypothetical protein OQA88_10480 [Cercophora sp. LCS_1]